MTTLIPVMKFCKKCQCDQERYSGGQCKECTKRLSRAWGASHTEQVKKTKTIYRAINQDMLRAKDAAYRASNTEKFKKRDANYYTKNAQRILASKAEYYEKNREAEVAKKQTYYQANPEKFVIWVGNRRAKKLAVGGRLSQGLAVRLFKLQKGKCPCCKQALGDKYHLDHIIPIALGGTNTDDNIQLLRSTCNHQKWAKHPIDFMQSRGFLL